MSHIKNADHMDYAMKASVFEVRFRMGLNQRPPD